MHMKFLRHTTKKRINNLKQLNYLFYVALLHLPRAAVVQLLTRRCAASAGPPRSPSLVAPLHLLCWQPSRKTGRLQGVRSIRRFLRNEMNPHLKGIFLQGPTQATSNCIQTAVGAGPTQPTSPQPSTKNTVNRS